MKDIIIGLCNQISKIQAFVSINRIDITNVAVLKEKDVRIIDWSAAGLREEIKSIDKNNAVKMHFPVLL